MKSTNAFAMQPGWRLLLRDVGIHPANVLRRAGLPEDLLSRPGASLGTADYFRFWNALDEEANDPTLPLRIGGAISVEAFDAPIFAALCSPNLNTALDRLRRYKPLIGPVALHLHQGARTTRLEIEWLDKTVAPPEILVATELVFFVQIARLATRERIHAVAITTPFPPRPEAIYTEYFGCRIEAASAQAIVFSAEDAARPFLTANEQMWEFFQPELRKRLSELDDSATIVQRVRGALLEMLPSGSSSLTSVSRRLSISTRTLQRRLQAEGSSFQHVLDATREELARHYLGSSTMSGAEIAFLLGYEDPNSFFRAFHAWTGSTPEQVRHIGRG